MRFVSNLEQLAMRSVSLAPSNGSTRDPSEIDGGDFKVLVFTGRLPEYWPSGNVINMTSELKAPWSTACPIRQLYFDLGASA